MKNLPALALLMFVALCAVSALGQANEKSSALKWTMVSADTLSKVEVAGISNVSAKERAGLVRLSRGKEMSYVENLTFFHCGKRQMAIQITTVYSASGQPTRMQAPNELYSRVKKGSLDETTLNFVCRLKIGK